MSPKKEEMPTLMKEKRPMYKVEIVDPVQDKGTINKASMLKAEELLRMHQRVEHNTITVGDNLSRFSALEQEVDEF